MQIKESKFAQERILSGLKIFARIIALEILKDQREEREKGSPELLQNIHTSVENEKAVKHHSPV